MRYARRLLTEALRRDPRLLTTEQRFWKPEVFDLLLVECDDRAFEDPTDALKLAQLALQLAELVADLEPTADKQLMLFRAYCVLGSTQRAVADLAAATRTYEKAAALPVSKLDQADLLRRRAYLYNDQRNLQAARNAVEDAIRIHRLNGDLVDRHQLGCCMLALGQIEFESGDPAESVDPISASLNHLDLRRDPKVYYAALHNLTSAFVEVGEREQLLTALKNLEYAHQRLGSVKKRHLAKYKLWWLQGLVHARLGTTGKAEVMLRNARKQLVSLPAPYEVGMISLDLACLYLSEGRAREIELLARDTHHRFTTLSVEREALAALSLWMTAIKKHQITRELLATVREKLTAFAAP